MKRTMPMVRQYMITIIAYINQLIWSQDKFMRSSSSIMIRKVCSLGILMSLKVIWNSMCSVRMIRCQIQQVWKKQVSFDQQISYKFQSIHFSHTNVQKHLSLSLIRVSLLKTKTIFEWNQHWIAITKKVFR